MYVHSSAATLGVFWPGDDDVLVWLLAGDRDSGEYLEAIEESAGLRFIGADVGLSLSYLRSEFPELHGTEAMQEFMADATAAESVASRPVTVPEALNIWGRAVADGLWFGLRHRADPRRLLETDHREPDLEQWQEARSAGLELPERPDYFPLSERASVHRRGGPRAGGTLLSEVAGGWRAARLRLFARP
jgi:hypothetical protein